MQDQPGEVVDEEDEEIEENEANTGAGDHMFDDIAEDVEMA